MMKGKLKEKIGLLPNSPGVYIFKDKSGRIIYIGKAKSLKKRVQSYFSRMLEAKTQALVSKIADLEYICAASENQARILEASLIKERQPQYNIDLKDDKSFPLIKISDEEFSRISICRNPKAGEDAKDKAKYFGPYTNAKLLRQAFKVMRRIFGFRSCKIMPRHPCLYFRLGLCPAPCAGKISRLKYKEIIKDIILFLNRRFEELIDKLTRQMIRAAKARRFEEAGRLRDQISALSSMQISAYPQQRLKEAEGLKKLLGLKTIPLRIEAFDISNISGTQATGSMVSFYKGVPDKNNYRRFRIKTVKGINDYDMLREVIRRRYARLKEENKGLPDLVIVDGGKQHLLAAAEELKNLRVSVSLAGIAKERENVYVLGKERVLNFSSDTPALNLIRRVRDEAHRFALKYHHLLRKKKAFEK